MTKVRTLQKMLGVAKGESLPGGSSLRCGLLRNIGVITRFDLASIVNLRKIVGKSSRSGTQGSVTRTFGQVAIACPVC